MASRSSSRALRTCTGGAGTVRTALPLRGARAAARRRRRGRIAAAARRLRIVSLSGLGVHDVRFPTPSVRVGGPDLRLIGVAARLFALDLRRVPRVPKARGLRGDVLDRVDDDAEVL